MTTASPSSGEATSTAHRALIQGNKICRVLLQTSTQARHGLKEKELRAPKVKYCPVVRSDAYTPPQYRLCRERCRQPTAPHQSVKSGICVPECERMVAMRAGRYFTEYGVRRLSFLDKSIHKCPINRAAAVLRCRFGSSTLSLPMHQPLVATRCEY